MAEQISPYEEMSAITISREYGSGGGEIGVRLGQVSEFSLLIAFLAMQTGLITPEASMLIQFTAILTFIANTYMVLFRYPSPIAISDRLRRD